MHRRGALIFDSIGFRFEQRDGNPLLHQRKSHDGADRTGPDYDNAIIAFLHFRTTPNEKRFVYELIFAPLASDFFGRR
jgi:hypothetical protein